jgi:hypothetical protein
MLDGESISETFPFCCCQEVLKLKQDLEKPLMFWTDGL